MEIFLTFLFGLCVIANIVNSDQQVYIVDTYDDYDTREECASLAIEDLEKILSCNTTSCDVNETNIKWCFDVDPPRPQLKWSICICGNNWTYAGNGSDDLLTYDEVQQIYTGNDTRLLYIPLVPSELQGSIFNCTVFGSNDQGCQPNKLIHLEVLIDNQLSDLPSVLNFQLGSGVNLNRWSVYNDDVVGVAFAAHNFFCVDGKTKGRSILPMWRLGNTSVQAISLYQYNITPSLQNAVNQCISCDCVRELFHAKNLYSLLEYSQINETSNLSAFVVYGYSGTPANIEHYRCLTLPNLFVSFIVASGVKHSSEELEFSITTIKNRTTIKKYIVEFDFFQGDPSFYSQSSSQLIEEHSNTCFWCNASTSVNATLQWKDRDGLIEEKKVEYRYQELNDSYVEDLCDNFAPAQLFYINLYIKQTSQNDSDYTIVLNQSSILLICNAERFHQGHYRCFASNSNKTGPSLSLLINHPNMFVAVVSVVSSISGAFVVTLLIVLIVLCGCLHARAIKSEPIQMRSFELNEMQLNDNNIRFEFPRRNLRFDKVLGEGQFGIVWKAYADGICFHDRSRKIVAVKTLKDNATFSDKDDLNTELETMKKMEPHPNIINFLGQCSETDTEPLFILMEFAVFGSLKDFLKTVKDISSDRRINAETMNMLKDRTSTEHCFCHSLSSPITELTNPAAIAHASRLLRLLNSETYVQNSEPDSSVTVASCVHRSCLEDYPYWIDTPFENEYYNSSTNPVSSFTNSTSGHTSESFPLNPYINSPVDESYAKCLPEEHNYGNRVNCENHNVSHELQTKMNISQISTTAYTGEKYLSYFDILDFAYQIARGMEHLDKMKCVHRDLAARNVLIAEGFLLKIGDFGLARDLSGQDYYRKITSGRVPARWMAVESLEERKHTSQSDVWSYGVLLWEIFTFGSLPYGRERFANSLENLCSYIKRGNRLQKPDFCSEEMYFLLLLCWNSTPEKRPSFSQLVSFFKLLLDFTKDYFILCIQDAAILSEIRQSESKALSIVFDNSDTIHLLQAVS